MAFLTLGAMTLEIDQDGADEVEPYEVGDFERSFNGSGRVSIRAFKREWRMRTGAMTDAEIATLKGIVGFMDAIAIGGDAIDDAPIFGHVRITNKKYIPDDLQHRRVCTLSIFEA